MRARCSARSPPRPTHPAERRLPVIAHWGITGGDFSAAAGAALDLVDLSVVQTFTFQNATSRRARSVANSYEQMFGENIAGMHAAVGFAHAYDLTHLLAMAIRKAGTTDRKAVRSALENLGAYSGLVRDYPRPFSPTQHEALDQRQVFMARFAKDGTLFKVRSQ